jgi:histone H3/H4
MARRRVAYHKPQPAPVVVAVVEDNPVTVAATKKKAPPPPPKKKKEAAAPAPVHNYSPNLPKSAGKKKRRSPKPVPEATLRRYVLRNGYKRVGDDALAVFGELCVARLDRITSVAVRLAALEGRCSIKGRDMDRAMKRRGLVIL